MERYRAQFRSRPASARDARLAVIDYARRCGFQPAALCEIALATGEALANAVEHGNMAFGFIEVTCSFSGDALSIAITDGGPGFDAARIGERPRDPDSTRGFGLAIMRATMDTVAFEASGRTVVLGKRLGRPRVNSDWRNEA